MRVVPWEALVGGVVLTLGGGLMAIVSWLSWTRDLPRNRFVGLRTERTMRSLETWQSAHHAAAPVTALAALSLLAAGVWLLVDRPADRRAKVIAGVGAGGFGLLVVAALVVGQAAI